MNRDLRTVYLGRYDDLEVPIVLEILAEHGIVAMPKEDPASPDFAPYRPAFGDRGIVLVEAGRAEDAQRILAEELPKHLEGARGGIDALEAEDQEP